MPVSDDLFLDAQDKAKQLETSDAARLEVFDAVDQIYFMSDESIPERQTWIRKTFSPDGHNAEDGAVRLLQGADPVFKVPMETNLPEISKTASDLEQAANTIWRMAGKVAGKPRHYDPIRSGVHYDEVHIAVRSTKAIVEDLRAGKAGKGSTAYAERVAQMTPVLFDCINPRDGHCEWGSMGLSAYYSKQKFTVAEVRARYGQDRLSGQKATQEIELHDYWNLDNHFVWTTMETEPLVAEENDLGMIPVAAVICEGGFLFNRSGQDSRRPLLYTIHKSNLWKRQNLLLTVSTSLVFLLGSNPALIHEGPAENFVLDRTEPGGIVHVEPGEKVYGLSEKVLDPSLVTLKQQVDSLVEESTIYKPALGGSLGGNAPFSTVSLVAQQGRLPLIAYQRMISMCITNAMQIAFTIIKRDNVAVRARGENGLMTIDAADIPDYFDFDAALEITLPQDARMNVTVAAQAVESGLASKRYALETYMQYGQADKMMKEIMEERFADMFAQFQLQAEAQKLQAQQQAQAQPQPDPNMPPPQMPQGDPGAQMGGQGMPRAPMMGPQEPMGTPMGPGGMPPDMGNLPPEMMGG